MEGKGKQSPYCADKDSQYLPCVPAACGTLRSLENIGVIKPFKVINSGQRRYDRIEIVGAKWIPPEDVDIIDATNKILLKEDMNK